MKQFSSGRSVVVVNHDFLFFLQLTILGNGIFWIWIEGF